MFIVVRHGNTFEASTKPRRIGARTDLPLTRTGIEQARLIGAHFASLGIRFDRVMISPLKRTRQTADQILAQLPSPPKAEIAEFLREIDHGPDENMQEDAVIERIGADALTAWETRAAVPEGWIVGPQERIAAWSALFADHDNGEENILLVTSSGAARFALMADARLRAQGEGMKALKLPTGGYGIIKRGPEGDLKLAAWGKRP